MTVSSVKEDTAGQTPRNKLVQAELISTVGSYKAESTHVNKYKL